MKGRVVATCSPWGCGWTCCPGRDPILTHFEGAGQESAARRNNDRRSCCHQVVWKERPRQDSNLKPSAPEADALSNCATRTNLCPRGYYPLRWCQRGRGDGTAYHSRRPQRSGSRVRYRYYPGSSPNSEWNRARWLVGTGRPAGVSRTRDWMQGSLRLRSASRQADTQMSDATVGGIQYLRSIHTHNARNRTRNNSGGRG